MQKKQSGSVRPDHLNFARHRAGYTLCLLTVVMVGLDASCTAPPPPPPANGEPPPSATAWRAAFDSADTGALSSVWGSSANDIFIVGGTPDGGEVYHFDGSTWRAMEIPQVPLLVWIFGFGPNDVIAVGEQGGAIRFDGETWEPLDTGTDEDLWGIWGNSSSDAWVVGGDVGTGDPVILHFDGDEFTQVDVPDNDRSATSLFKVWGIGSKVFAVGENGLIIEFSNGVWSQVPAGAAADDDFVSLWGTSETNIVAVGGRGSARIARYDGSNWTTELFSGTPGLNAVFMDNEDFAIVGGINGFGGAFSTVTNELESESTPTNVAIHAAWGDGTGNYYAVGGRFTQPYSGVALVRQAEDLAAPPFVPPVRSCNADSDCPDGNDCTSGECVAIGGCNNDGDCGTGEICRDGECVAEGSCDDDTDCSDDEICQDGQCATPTGELCEFEADCGLGFNCTNGQCSTALAADVQYLVTTGANANIVAEGGDAPVFQGFQGGSHTFVTLRTTGFAPNAFVIFSSEIILEADGRIVSSRQTFEVSMTDIGDGVNELRDIFVQFDNATFSEVINQAAVISLSLESVEDSGITASLSQRVVLVEADG